MAAFFFSSFCSKWSSGVLAQWKRASLCCDILWWSSVLHWQESISLSSGSISLPGPVPFFSSWNRTFLCIASSYARLFLYRSRRPSSKPSSLLSIEQDHLLKSEQSQDSRFLSLTWLLLYFLGSCSFFFFISSRRERERERERERDIWLKVFGLYEKWEDQKARCKWKKKKNAQQKIWSK